MQKRSYDDILVLLEDAYDSLIAPRYIVRKTTNKLHLIFMAFAKGLEVLFNVVYAIKYRFDPKYSEDDDLASISAIVGEGPFPGTHSVLMITAFNTGTTISKTLAAGRYEYISVSGEVFYFDLDAIETLAPLGSVQIASISTNIGAYPVSTNAKITVTRTDGVLIDSSIEFSCESNETLLGTYPEDSIAYRNRIIADTERQDEIREIQEAIRRIPGIFECNCAFNPTAVPVVYDGITLAAKELLIVITGTVTAEVANAVATRTCYKTHMVDEDDVVQYVNELYVGGFYPVYFTRHLNTDFNLNITYSYDPRGAKEDDIEANIARALLIYTNPTRHYDSITEYDIYNVLKGVGGVSVTILNVDIISGGSPVSYLSVPKTRLAKLGTTTFTPVTV